jgi:NAD(P)-dependent dehydrogenase (short-subunit alcohol dehydrogenase family)
MADKKVILITGGKLNRNLAAARHTDTRTANTGIGYEIVKALYATSVPYEFIVGSRTLSKGEDAIAALKSEIVSSPSSLSALQIDVSSDASLEVAIKGILEKHGRIDTLINNAGAGFDVDIRDNKVGLREGFNAAWDINVSGTHVLTTLAAPLLLKSADPRLLFITSGTSSLIETDPGMWHNMEHLACLNASPPKGWPKPKEFSPIATYRTTKTGLNMLMREWVRILREDGVKIWAISPGFLATGLAGMGRDNLRKMGALEPSVGGEFVRDVVEGKRDADVGKIISASVIRSNLIQPW